MKQTNTYQPIGFRNSVVNIGPGDTTTAKDIFAAGANDSTITAIYLTSIDPGSEVIQLFLNNGSIDAPLAAFNVPPNSGSNTGAPPVEALSATGEVFPLANGKRILPLPAGWKLRAAAKAAVGANVTVNVFALDF